MGQVSKQQPVSKTAFRVLVALNATYCLNGSSQSIISAAYPPFEDDLALSLAQTGLITLVYQLPASVFQPVIGLTFDKRPVAWPLPIGMNFTLVDLLDPAFPSTLHWVLISVFLAGIGSSVLHPKASRITSLASGERRGLTQSLFQMDSNLGGSLGPLLVALLVAPHGRAHIALFSILAFVAILMMTPICRWYKAYLSRVKRQKKSSEAHVEMPLSLGEAVFLISILLTLIFSRCTYMVSLNSYCIFHLTHKFGAGIQTSQICLSVFLIATAIGTLADGPIGDKTGRKYAIRGSVLGAAPFSLLMSRVGFIWTIVFSFCVGLVLSSTFPAILLYTQELLPHKLGLILGLFFRFTFGMVGIASAISGNVTDHYGIEAVYNVCDFMPLLGLVTWFLPNLRKK